VGSLRMPNEESDPLSWAGWRVRNQPDPNEVARWVANASPATDKERCPVGVDTDSCWPAPSGVESCGRGGRRRLNGCHVLGRARRRCLGRSAGPTANEDDEPAQN
jgi:hypothetical protein